MSGGGGEGGGRAGGGAGGGGDGGEFIFGTDATRTVGINVGTARGEGHVRLVSVSRGYASVVVVVAGVTEGCVYS